MTDKGVVWMAAYSEGGAPCVLRFLDRKGNPTPIVQAWLDEFDARGVALPELEAAVLRSVNAERGEVIARQRIELEEWRRMFGEKTLEDYKE
jgi:hypothetical protein